MKATVINILAHVPEYGLYEREPRPAHNWDTLSGGWVGVWGYDWPDLLGGEVLKISDEFEYEVWQPDLRADRVYECKLESGVRHLLFPATARKLLYGLRPACRILSRSMVRALRRTAKSRDVVLQINDQPLFLGADGNSLDRIPAVLSFLGEIIVPGLRMRRPTRNIAAKINDFCDHLAFTKILRRIDVVTYSNDVNLGYLKRAYGKRLEKLAMGCDFSYWKPLDRLAVRRKLNLDVSRKVFFGCSNLIASKQVDKVVSALMKMDDDRDFLFVIAGHGSSDYEAYLRNLSRPLLFKDRIRFAGHVSDGDLREYYNAADFFIHASLQEGASVSVIKAMACGLPVISTPIGGTAEIMTENNAGCFLDTADPDSWTSVFKDVIDGRRRVDRLDREIAKKAFDWPVVALGYLDIYRTLRDKYYGDHKGRKAKGEMKGWNNG